MNKTADVLVVGGGLEGSSTAWGLTGRGVSDVLLLERATIGAGGTGKSSGVVRCHYGVPSLASMAWEGTQFLEQAREILGHDVGFHRTGYLVGAGPDDVDMLAANVAMHRALGIDTDLIGPDRAAQLWPTARLDDFAGFAFEPRGGYGDAYQTAQSFAAAARRGGARVLQGTEVTGLAVSGDRVTGVMLADGRRVSAGMVVIAAGPWSAALLAPLGVDLPITVHREPVLLVDPGTPIGAVPVLSDLVSLQYVRSEVSGALLVGNSDMSELEPADPDNYRNAATPDFLHTAAAKVTHRFPGLPAAAVSSTYAGCYDVTPDFNPIIGAVGVEGVLVAAGFSGHGYKISPAVGRLVADLVCDGTSSDPRTPEADFDPRRFEQGRPLLSRHPYANPGQMR